MVPLDAILGVSKFFVFIILLPAVSTGFFSLLIYYGLTKIQPPASRLTPILPVIIGLFLCVIIPFISRLSLLIDLLIITLGVLTSFMALRKLFPEHFLNKILLSGSVIAVAIRLIFGFATTFGANNNSTGSPIFRLLSSISASDAGFLIMSSIALYVEMVIISAVLFGLILVTIKIFQKISEILYD